MRIMRETERILKRGHVAPRPSRVQSRVHIVVNAVITAYTCRIAETAFCFFF